MWNNRSAFFAGMILILTASPLLADADAKIKARLEKLLPEHRIDSRLVPVDNSLIFINFMSRLRAKRTDSLTNRFFLLSIWPV